MKRFALLFAALLLGVTVSAQELVKVERPWILEDEAWKVSEVNGKRVSKVIEWRDNLATLPEEEVNQVYADVIARWKYLREYWATVENKKPGTATLKELRRIQDLLAGIANTEAIIMDGVSIDMYTGKTKLDPKNLSFYLKDQIALIGHVQGKWVFIHGMQNRTGYEYAYEGNQAVIDFCKKSVTDCKARLHYYRNIECKNILIDSEVDPERDQDSYQFDRNLLFYYIEGLEEAMLNNDPNLIFRYPYPKAGALNKKHHDSALKASIANRGSNGILDVVITSDDYGYTRDAYGRNVKKRISGYLIVNMGGGDKYMIELTWAADALPPLGADVFSDQYKEYSAGSGYYIEK
ncbi:MAG: hypothetical protein IK008_05230 [Bacteroidales bacterium]|nr:hypothetical protein [Bacteroidales bacterium]